MKTPANAESSHQNSSHSHSSPSLNSPAQYIARYIDGHNHLAELLDSKTLNDGSRLLDEWLLEAHKNNINFFMQGGIGPENWERQLLLHNTYPHSIGLCFGLHPYWVSDHTTEECEHALDLLAQKTGEQLKSENTIFALGELGLDFRPHIVKDTHELQMQVFEAQLELAEIFKIPMVFHFVRAHQEALKILDLKVSTSMKGMVHSFNGSYSQAKEWMERKYLLSIGGPVCYPQNKKLHEAVKKMPLEYLILETDSPDQPPPGYLPGKNPPHSLHDVAKSISLLRNLDVREILDISTTNFQRTFGDVFHAD